MNMQGKKDFEDEVPRIGSWKELAQVIFFRLGRIESRQDDRDDDIIEIRADIAKNKEESIVEITKLITTVKLWGAVFGFICGVASLISVVITIMNTLK